MKCPPPPEILSSVLKCTGYQMKAYNIDFIYILINEN